MIELISVIITIMIVNRLLAQSTKNLLLQPAFFFSAKKKQLELTLKTPYRTSC